MRNGIQWALFSTVMGLALAAPAGADTIVDAGIEDPSNLHVNTGTLPATQPNDPRLVPLNEFGFNIAASNVTDGNNPFVVLLGIPNVSDPHFLDSMVVTANLYAPATSTTGQALTVAGGTTAYANFVSGAFQGTLNSTGSTSANGSQRLQSNNHSPNDLYSMFGIQGNDSQSFANWSGLAVYPNGLPNPDYGVPSFGIFAYALSLPNSLTSGFGSGDLIDVKLSADLPAGVYVAGVSFVGSTAYTVPFTETGVTSRTPDVHTDVPEPSQVALMVMGLAGLLAGRRARG